MCKKLPHASTWGCAQHVKALKQRGKAPKKAKFGVYWCSEHSAYHITRKITPNCIFKTK